jgi:hypothetical protein
MHLLSHAERTWWTPPPSQARGSPPPPSRFSSNTSDDHRTIHHGPPPERVLLVPTRDTCSIRAVWGDFRTKERRALCLLRATSICVYHRDVVCQEGGGVELYSARQHGQGSCLVANMSHAEEELTSNTRRMERAAWREHPTHHQHFPLFCDDTNIRKRLK